MSEKDSGLEQAREWLKEFGIPLETTCYSDPFPTLPEVLAQYARIREKAAVERCLAICDEYLGAARVSEEIRDAEKDMLK